MEFVKTVGTPIAEKLSTTVADSIWEQVSYVLRYNRNITDLKSKLISLKSSISRMENAIKDAENQLLRVEKDVEEWVSLVKTKEKDAGDIINYATATKTTWCFDLLPKVIVRYKFSKEAKSIGTTIEELANKKFDRIGYPDIVTGFTPPTEFEEFKSREDILKTIEGLLEEKGEKAVDVIGIWGPGGVGKNTLVRKVAATMKDKKSFRRIILASASLTYDPNADLTKIQQEIADNLGFKLEADSSGARTNKLHQRLLKEDSILIILDDAWRKIKWDQIGIPLQVGVKPDKTGVPHGDKPRVCKLLVTSRCRNVILDMGASDRSCLHLQAVNEREAQDFFRETVGIKKEDPFPSVYEKIIRRCSGLPVLLIPVARSLKNVWNQHIWEATLDQLEKFEGKKDWDKQAYATLERSYNFLDSETQDVFNVVAQAGNPYPGIEVLLTYAIGCGLFKNCETLVQAKNKLIKIVDDLTSSSLLEEATYYEPNEMLDAIRRFAISRLNKGDKYALAKHRIEGLTLEKFLTKQAFNKCTSISLRRCKIQTLPEVLHCPNLEFLVLELDENPSKVHLSPDFFTETNKLRVLDLSGLILMPFPSSMKFLDTLEALILNACEVNDISIIGELKNLQILALLELEIAYLPEELKELRCLKLLNLESCINLKKFPIGIPSCFSELEVLNLKGTKIKPPNLPNFKLLDNKYWRIYILP